ncbi:MAG TPA: PEGA domain-containing protein [Polyangiales bacterium]|nr:PEGA domain-containing protein [Polyangiales bacterium]
MYLFLAWFGGQSEALAQSSGAPQTLFFGAVTELSTARLALARKEPPEPVGDVWLLSDHWPSDSGVAPAELVPLRRVEDLLAAARHSRAELDEASALRRLAEAQRLAWDALGVPGAAAFCAEVELQLAVTAAQAGHWELAADSLARAARLDGARRLLAAEASPQVVALADRVFRDAAVGPEGELPISTDAPGARIYIDDVDRGLAPQRVRLRAGTHALRIEAAGRVPYHARIEVAQGVRPAQRFVLAPDPRALAKARLRAALRAEPTAVAHATAALLAAAPELARVVWSERDARAERGLVYACDAHGCSEPLRVERGVVLGSGQVAGLTPETLRDARAWLHGVRVSAEPAVPVENTPWWSRWYVWSTLAALAIGAGAAVAVALDPVPERRLRVVVDASDLR